LDFFFYPRQCVFAFFPHNGGVHRFNRFHQADDFMQQAVWRFEMRDECQPEITLGNILQMR
jgi:hypothetical protein